MESKTSESNSISTTHKLGEERTLPTIQVGTKQYLIDIANGELRGVDDPLRTIGFHAMVSDGNQFSFLYDVAKDKAIINKTDRDNSTIAEWISLPAIDKLDPEFIRLMKLEESLVIEKMRDGTSVYYDDRKPEANDRGPLLPIVNFYGTDFFLDLRLKEFRQVDNPVNSIPWKALQLDDFHFSLLYDAQKNNVYEGSDLQAKESHVKYLFLPPVDIMVSEGIARHRKMQEEKSKNVIEVRVEKKRKFKR